jgi:hypothetical protein
MCCGNKRMSFPTNSRNTSRFRPLTPAAQARVTYFQYLGSEPMTIRGSNTGASYQFAGYGSKVAVDMTDRASLATVADMHEITKERGAPPFPMVLWTALGRQVPKNSKPSN